MKNINIKEIWKPVQYKNFRFYVISNYGRIKNSKTGKILKTHIRNGYYSVSLCNSKKKKYKTISIHRCMGQVFIGGVAGKTVNHKDGNKLNNLITNLEITTYKENTKHATEMGLYKPHPKAVLQYDLNGNFLTKYRSILEASQKSGANDRHISSVCKGKRKTCGGYIWKYKNAETRVFKCDGKLIKHFNNYKITKDGKVYSIRAIKFLKEKTLPSGYKSVKLCNNGKRKDFYIHRLVAEAYLSNDSSKKWVNHIDGNKSNNKLENLEWVTHKENMIHYHKEIKPKIRTNHLLKD